MKIKFKVCKSCAKEYKPYNSLQVVCSPLCALNFNSKKEIKKRIKEIKKNLLTHKDYLKILQMIFNKYIRLRDKDKPCISCGKEIKNGHASHYYSVGNYPNLRFNEHNVHLSCVECNVFKHGNLIEYGKRLPDRIGLLNTELMYKMREAVNKISIPELEKQIKEYKLKIKNLNL